MNERWDTSGALSLGAIAAGGVALSAVGLAALGCGSASMQAPYEPSPSPEAQSTLPAAPMGGAFALDDAERAPEEEGRRARAKPKAALRQEMGNIAAVERDDAKVALDPEPEPNAEGESRQRSWFPEAFLWAPELLTGAEGRASLEVLVPDQLTTWRVLALAHDQRGQQTGAVQTFDGTLPIYVDPVVPGWLYSGDRVLLPVQMTNTTGQAVDVSVKVEATGAMTGAGTAELTLSPGGSDVRSLPFSVDGAGEASISAELTSAAASDSALRTIPVMPRGRPVERFRGGTLAQSRTFRIPPPEGVDPATERIEVLVFPGALSVVDLELQRVASGARPEDPAYSAALTAHAARLASASGAEIDPVLLRKLDLLSWQRILPAARAPSHGAAADLLSSLGPVTGEARIEDLKARLLRTVAQGQRADGTWSRDDRATLQRVLVDTAFAARSLPQSEKGPRLRAQAAVERYLHEIKDPYTAAVVLSAHLVDGDSEEALMNVLTAAIVQGEDGLPTLLLDQRVENPWGRAPARAELLAWAVLALPSGQEQGRDLAAQLMQSWSPHSGFGAGPADSVALAAVTDALGAIASSLSLSLSFDGQPIATASLDPSQPKVPARLTGQPGSGSDVEITVSSDTAAPGLAFIATRTSYVPWSDADRLPGVEVSVSASPMSVGRDGELTFTMVAPSGSRLRVEQPLPSGAEPGEDAAVRASAVGVDIRSLQDRIVLETRPFQPGEILTLKIPVIPSFAGSFQTAPLLVSADGGSEVPLEPITWAIAP